MIPEMFIKSAEFKPRSLEFPNAWVGHLPFAAWLIQEISPAIFVELGTHSGNSYFSFCQAVYEKELNTKCYAVDTWQGDEHAGHYDDDIFIKVNAHNEQYYAGFSRLLRTTFDNAVSYFENASIDLLHIDGLHTYETVRHDFETWLPKLAPGAVVVFHDTNVRERNFGVWRLWAELQAIYPNNLEFFHSNGLGVMQLKTAPPHKKLNWLQPNSTEREILRKYFAALGAKQLERYDLIELRRNSASLNQAVTERDGQIASLSQAVTERDGQIASLNQVVSERDTQIVSLSQAVTERDGQIASLSQVVDERDGQIASLSQAVTERDGQIASLSQVVDERDGQIAGLVQEIAALRNSTSWRLTRPLRLIRHQIVCLQHLGRNEHAATQVAGESQIMRAKKSSGIMVSALIRRIYLRTPWLVHLRATQQRIVRKMGARLQAFGHSTQNELSHHDLVMRRSRPVKARSSVTSALPFIDLSVVTYNSERWVGLFLASLQNQAYPTTKINLTFVDHGSVDATVSLLREAQARLISAFANISIIEQDNLGFGMGHDRAIRLSQNDFLLVSNIDLEFAHDSIETVVVTACADEPEVAAWELRQVPHEHPKHYDPVTLETTWQSHACVLLRRAAYERVGGYDGRIFMYGEDVELSYRLRSYGYILRYCPAAVVRHHSYESDNFLLKPLQYTGSTFANAAIRLRYGTQRDRLSAFMAMFWLAVFANQPFDGSRRAVWVNTLKLVRQTKHFSRGKGPHPAYFPFRFFDYEMARFGASYKVETLAYGPLVSIITRTYEARGRDELLKQAGRSIANQTYRHIEWIVVQDGGESQHDVVAAIGALAPGFNVRFIASAKKNGRSFAGNIGLEAAGGDYCMFLDDDDLLYADHVETLVATLMRCPTACAAYALSFEVLSNCNEGVCKEVSYVTPAVFHQHWDYAVLQDHNFIPIQSILFSRKLFLERGGFDTDLEQLEDWNLWLRYGFGNKFEFVPKTTSLFRTPANPGNRLRRQLDLHRAYEEAKSRASASINKNFLGTSVNS